MALLSNIVIDLASQTVILTATVDGNNVEVMTYDNTTKQITFDPRAYILVSFTEFLAFCDQVNIFETAILFNFPNISTFITIPFIEISINELHDGGMWNLAVTTDSDPKIVEYQGTQSSSKLEMLERSGSKSLTFPEWLYFLQALNHYRLSIKAF